MLEHPYVTKPWLSHSIKNEDRVLLINNKIVSFSFRYAWTWSLILSDVSDDDAGEYTCRISSSSPNDQTLTIIKRFHLTVLSKRLNLTSICDFSSCWTKSKRRKKKRSASDANVQRHQWRIFEHIAKISSHYEMKICSCNRHSDFNISKAFLLLYRTIKHRSNFDFFTLMGLVRWNDVFSSSVSSFLQVSDERMTEQTDRFDSISINF